MTALLFIVIPLIAACVIAFILGICWEAGRAEQEDYERQLERDVCPWPMKERF